MIEGRKRQSEKMKGRTKENNEGMKKMSEKLTGRTKENNEGIRRMSEKLTKQTGENNPNWKGGTSFEPYCEKFDDDLKERVRNFFSRCCYVCGKNEIDNAERLSVHHVNYDKMICCNNIKPLFVPLCHNCHTKTNGDREYWEEFFTISLNYLTQGECFIKK